MSITHHPGDETVAAFASGTLDEARALVVATHVSLCAQCRKAMRAFEQIGGTMLEGIEPETMPADALARAMRQLDSGPGRERQRSTPTPAASDIPAPLRPYEPGPWRRIGHGVEWRAVDVPSGPDVRVFMLRAQPGIRLPRHRHKGDEWTCVFEGAFRHDLGRFGPGDFDEADEAVEHNPVVEDGVPCICLVTLEGGIAFQGWMGRLLQPFVRI